ncbi:MAG: hypothetical protein ACFCU3_08040 [Verrucomicrobiales bacterium]
MIAWIDWIDWTVETWIVLVGWGLVLIGYVVLMQFQGASRAFQQGRRCVQRYTILQWLPGWFGFFYVLWVYIKEGLLRWYAQDRVEPLLPWGEGWQGLDWLGVWAPEMFWLGLEKLAGLFHVVATPGPLTLFLAAWLLTQPAGLTVVKQLYTRFGRWSWCFYSALSFGLIGVLLRWFYILPPSWWPSAFFQSNWMMIFGVLEIFALMFEYALAYGVQLYLILFVINWINGRAARPSVLTEQSARRWVASLIWVGPLALLGASLVQGLWLMEMFGVLAEGEAEQLVPRARAVLSLVVIAGASFQWRLLMLDTPVTKLVAQERVLIRQRGGEVFWFMLVASLHLGLLILLETTVNQSIGDWNLVALLVRLGFALVWGWLLGWLLAAWICLLAGGRLFGKHRLTY